MLRNTIAMAVILIMGTATPVSSGNLPPKLTQTVDKSNAAALAPLLELGELSLVESHSNGHLKQATVIGLIKAPPARVWAVITDYKNYPKMIPSVAEIEVVSKKGDDVVLEMEIEVPGSNVEYKRHDRLFPQRRIEMWPEDDEGDITRGRWRWDLVPHAAGTQTILIYTLYYDVGESSWILRQFLKETPTAEHGLNVATGQVSIRAFKQAAERRR
jgi:ribosome-associated toxin RatA of RatAB toxin-antitoxin module